MYLQPRTISTSRGCFNTAVNIVSLSPVTSIITQSQLFVNLTVKKEVKSLVYSVAAGLPDILSTICGIGQIGETPTWSGALYQYNGSKAKVASISGGSYPSKTGFQASRSNVLYGKSNTITPLSRKVRYFMKY